MIFEQYKKKYFNSYDDINIFYHNLYYLFLLHEECNEEVNDNMLKYYKHYADIELMVRTKEEIANFFNMN